MSDRVTWLLPVKNGMPYLPETLASIKAQTYTDWEVLAWDNGSTDGTLDILNEWIPSILPGRVVTGRPLGLGASLAEMVKECNTELCARIDADDVNLPERLEREFQYLKQHPEIAVVGSSTHRIDAFGTDHGILHQSPISHEEIIVSMLHRGFNPIAHPTVLFRRSAILQCGNYRAVGDVNIEDYDLWLRVAAQYRLANLADVLVNYRVHSRSTTQIAIAQNKLLTALDVRFYEHAPNLYGLSEHELRLLRERRHPNAIDAFQRISGHLYASKAEEGVKGPQIGSSFYSVRRSLVAPKDVKSRLVLAMSEGQLFLELKHITRDVLKHAVGTRGRVASLNFYKHQHRRREEKAWVKRTKLWLLEQEQFNSNIHSTIEITGDKTKMSSLSIGTDCIFERDITIWISPDHEARPHLSVGERAFIGRNSYIGLFQPITIGSSAMIGAYSYIISVNHKFSRRDVMIRDHGFEGAPIEIGEDVWLGTHVVVLPGVTIGKGAIVAACSLVNKDIPPYEVWGGVPAKFLKHRPE